MEIYFDDLRDLGLAFCAVPSKDTDQCCSRCQVPEIHWNLSTNRILTMEFIEGGQVNDRDYMKKHNINVNEVSWYIVCVLYRSVVSVRTHTNTHTTTPPQLPQVKSWVRLAFAMTPKPNSSRWGEVAPRWHMVGWLMIMRRMNNEEPLHLKTLQGPIWHCGFCSELFLFGPLTTGLGEAGQSIQWNDLCPRFRSLWPTPWQRVDPKVSKEQEDPDCPPWSWSLPGKTFSHWAVFRLFGTRSPSGECLIKCHPGTSLQDTFPSLLAGPSAEVQVGLLPAVAGTDQKRHGRSGAVQP